MINIAKYTHIKAETLYVKCNDIFIKHEEVSKQCYNYVSAIVYEYTDEFGELFMGHRGTASRLRHGGKYYILTAKHVVEGNDSLSAIPYEQLRFPISTHQHTIGWKESFQFINVHKTNNLKIKGELDEDLSDILVFEIDPKQARKYRHLFFNINNINVKLDWEYGYLLGIPTDNRITDYNTKSVHFQYVAAGIKSNGRLGNLVSIIALNKNLVGTNGDGYSGSPFFSVSSYRNSTVNYGGMVILGGNRNFHCIPANIIKGFIVEIQKVV